MARTLDKTKPFGMVCGNHLAAYVQDGVFFDSQGNETEDAPAEMAPDATRQPVAAAGSEQSEQLATQVEALEKDVAETRQLLAEAHNELAMQRELMVELKATADEMRSRMDTLATEVMRLSDASFSVGQPGQQVKKG